MNEAKVLESLDHPNIIKYFETFIYNHKLCIIMEYADNGKN
jgi:NIMA (never in mitosis gene a)-related kinase